MTVDLLFFDKNKITMCVCSVIVSINKESEFLLCVEFSHCLH